MSGGAPPDLGVDGLGREVLGGAMQPAGDHRAVFQGIRLPGERDEDTLGDVLSQVPVHDHAHGRRMHRVQVAADDLAERLLGIRPGVFREKLLVRAVVHRAWLPGDGGNGQMNCAAIRCASRDGCRSTERGRHRLNDQVRADTGREAGVWIEAGDRGRDPVE